MDDLLKGIEKYKIGFVLIITKGEKDPTDFFNNYYWAAIELAKKKTQLLVSS